MNGVSSAAVAVDPPRAAPDVAAMAGARPGDFLVADIGSSQVRMGLVSRVAGPAGAPAVIATRVFESATHPHLEDIVRGFCDALAVRPRELVLACAGYVQAGVVVSRHLAWPVVPGELSRSLGLAQVHFLNTLEALAYEMPGIDLKPSMCLKAGAGREATAGTTLILGVGHGLGAAALLPGRSRRVLATEIGQIQLAARVGLEQQVLANVAPSGAHIPSERLLSVPGLHRLYLALCAIRNRFPRHEDAGAVAAAALDGDELASEVLTLYCGWLGAFAGDLAAVYGTTGGIYLVGGLFARIRDFMSDGPFVERFLDKGVMRPFLQRVPIHVLERGWHGVVGAARWRLDVHRPGADTSTDSIATGDAYPPTGTR